MLLILFTIFIGITAIQIYYYLFIFSKFAFSDKEEPSFQKRKSSKPISVIICAKNQKENMSRLVPLLADQNYPDYELVLINDASTDDTQDFFEDLEKKHSNIKLVNVENNEAFWANKKYSLTLGIKAARKEYLLFIEPNCRPISKNWIQFMSSQFTDEKTIVLGYNGYEKVQKSFINKVFRFENILNTLQYFSWTIAGSPYTGKGKNLGYKREEFFEANGFMNHMKVKFGEDELFINQSATKENTAICTTPESFTYSEAKTDYKSLYADMVKAFDTTNHFKSTDQIRLHLFHASQFLFLALTLILLLFQYNWIAVFLIMVIRYGITFSTLGYTAKKLNEKELIYWYPFLEIVILYIQLNIFVIHSFRFTVKKIKILSKFIYWKLKNR